MMCSLIPNMFKMPAKLSNTLLDIAREFGHLLASSKQGLKLGRGIEKIKTLKSNINNNEYGRKRPDGEIAAVFPFAVLASIGI